MELQRRTALKGGAAAVAGALTGGPFAGLLAPAGAAAPQAPHRRLRAIPDLRDGQVRLHLPEGFQYRSFHDTEFAGRPRRRHRPARAATTAWAPSPGPNGNILLVRNHEVTNQVPVTAFGPGTPYDGHAGAGCTTIEVTKYGEVVTSWTSLNGTMFNCSGGVMPWGSWITCEETINGPDVGPDFQDRPNTDLEQKHGYVFEVPARTTARATASRSPGRDASRTRPCRSTRSTGSSTSPRTTSSSPPASTATSRRATPWRPATSTTRASSRCSAITGQPNAHLEARQPQRATYGVRWVDIDDPDPTMAPGTTNDQALVKVGDQGRAQGAALFSRLEGQVYDNNVVYFTSTQGGGDAEQDLGRAGRRRRQHQRLRQGQRPGLGLPLPLPDAAGPLPGPGRRRGGEPHLRLPRQHHHQRRRHARRLRGQHGRQLHPRPVPRRPAVGHRAEPARSAS